MRSKCVCKKIGWGQTWLNKKVYQKIEEQEPDGGIT